MFEIGLDLFTKTGHGNAYKQMDKWWLLDVEDIISKIDDPEIIKVTSNRIKYVFKDRLLI